MMMKWFRSSLDDVSMIAKEQQARELNECFAGPSGEHALTAILMELYWFSEATDQETMHCQNAAKRILRLMGAWDEREPGPVKMTHRLKSGKGSLVQRILGRE